MAIAVPTLLTGNAVTGAGTTVTLTVGVGGVPAGQVVLIGFVSNNVNTDGGLSCADSKGNTYINDAEFVGTTLRVAMFSSLLQTALVNGDTIVVTHPSCVRKLINGRYTNLAGKERSAQNNGVSTTPSSGNTGARTAASSLLVGLTGWRTAVTGETAGLGAGFARLTQNEASAGAVSCYIAMEDQIMSVAAGVDPATFTISISESWWTMAVVYPEAAAAGGGPGGRSDVDAITDAASITIAA